MFHVFCKDNTKDGLSPSLAIAKRHADEFSGYIRNDDGTIIYRSPNAELDALAGRCANRIILAFYENRSITFDRHDCEIMKASILAELAKTFKPGTLR